jgi:hypothetical protein
MCFVWRSEQTAIISLYSINWLASRRVRFVMSTRPPASLHISKVPTKHISLKFDTGNLKRTKTSATLHEGLNTLYCCRRHKFATKALLQKKEILLYCSQWDVAQRCTKGSPSRFHCNNGHANASQYYVAHTLQNRDRECVHRALQTESSSVIKVNFSLQMVHLICLTHCTP